MSLAKWIGAVSGAGVDVTVFPVTLAAKATLHTPSVIVNCTVTPVTLTAEAVLLAPSLAFDCTVTPTTIAAEATLHAPTIGVAIDIDIVGGYNLTAYNTPSVGSHCPVILPRRTQVTVPAEIGYTVTPSTLAVEATLHAPAIIVDCIVTPASLTGIATLQTPVTVNIQYPGSFSALATLHAPTICFDCTVTPATLAAAATLQTPLIALDITVTPAALTALATLLTPEVSVFYTDIPSFMEKDLIDPYSGGAWLWLCEIAVPGYDTKRIARNTEDLTYGLNQYDKFNLQIGEQMFSGDGSIPRVTLRVFQDVNRIIEDMVNATEGALGASVKLIRVCEKFLDTPVAALEADYDNLASESDSEWVTFTLGIPNPLTQRIPLRIYSSSSCPWATPTLFKGPECQYSGGDGTCTGTYEDCYVKGNAVHWGGELGLDQNVVRV